MGGTYLTVDLDYWTDYSSTSAPNRFFRQVFGLDCPKVVITSHESVVRYANKSGCRTIYNVDYHSDITDFYGEAAVDREFNEGTWANYIRWRRQGTFIWRHPHKHDCIVNGHCHSRHTQNPFNQAEFAGWKVVKRCRGLAGIPWDDVKEVCICLSIDWTNVEPVRDILHTIGRKDWVDWYYKDDAATYGVWDRQPRSYRLPNNCPEIVRYPLPYSLE